MPPFFLQSASRRGEAEGAANALYRAIVSQARNPAFYAGLGVPDSLDGRYDMIVLHTFLVLRRLRTESGAPGKRAGPVGQALVDLFIADMDRNLREMGVGDLGVGRRVKAMAKALYGRIAAYDTALAADGEALAAALRRNLFGSLDEKVAPDVAVLNDIAAYVRRSAAALAEQSLEELLAGGVAFADPPKRELPCGRVG